MFMKLFCHALVMASCFTMSLYATEASFYKFVFGKNAPIQQFKGLTAEESLDRYESFACCLRWHRSTAIGCREPRPF